MSSEDIQVIDPNSIPTELPNEYKISTEGGGYSPPNDERQSHLIRVGSFEKDSKKFKSIDSSRDMFREAESQSGYLEEITSEEWMKIKNRLDKISNRLIQDDEYRQELEKLGLSHEEAHRSHQVRKLERDVQVDSREAEKESVKVLLYEETEATIAGIRSGDIELEVKADYLFWRASTSFSAAMVPKYYGKEGLKEYLQRNISGILHGNRKQVEEHFMADLIIASGDVNLLEKIDKREFGIADLQKIAVNSIKEILLDPEQIIVQNVQSEEFNKQIDLKLIGSVNRRRDLINE